MLLPPMCLNRRYQAEGVRMYSQQTWERVMGTEGRAWVGRLAPHVRVAVPDQHPAGHCACTCDMKWAAAPVMLCRLPFILLSKC